MIATAQWLSWNTDCAGYWLIPLGPLCGTIICTMFAFHGNRKVRQLAHWPCILGISLAFVGGLIAARNIADLLPVHTVVVSIYKWITVGNLQIGLALFFDSLSCVMVCLVTCISLLVALYSVGYMRDDDEYGRYFATISLFVFSMIMLVLADNYLTLYLFWEGVGLCSYLLIGHWYERPSASAAASKAFLVNRVGDAAFLLAILLLWANCGTLQFGSLWIAASELPKSTSVLISLLLLAGACGKSAQVPLHVWLPDAMEGPTPVSALIHAATMVTAGVYLLARCFFLLAGAPEAQSVVMIVGITTALLAAIIAITQYDLKRVLAYSTISQLGLMFTSLGVASYQEKLLPVATAAAIFHLCMHGFFKALLFLSAGNIMHATEGIVDMRLLGGLRRRLPYTHACFAIGALALAAIPPLAGFWSKEAILEPMIFAARETRGWGIWLVIGCYLITGLLTAFYITRAYVLTFWGEKKLDSETVRHIHEPPRIMLIPVLLLAVASIVFGFLFWPTGLFENFIHLSEPFGSVDRLHGTATWMVVSIGMALVGTAAAAFIYGAVPDWFTRPAWSLRVLYILSSGRFFVDELYRFIIVRPGQILAVLAGWIDRLLDGVVDLTGWSVWFLGRLFRPMQNGQLQFYALAMLLGLAVFCVVLITRWGG